MSGPREPDPSIAVSEPLATTLASLPRQSGCYLFRSASDEVLYVGKAAVLRSRVRSYFQKSAQHTPKTAALVAEVVDVEVIVTSSEVEALVLENNLIKRHRPRFNIMLRDDKNFPYLKLTIKDDFPRVVLVRRPRSDGQQYFGPFLPASHARRTLRMIPRFFQVANCHLPFDGKQRPCLYYHIDQCLAPCAGKADPDEYKDRVSQAQMFLEGRDQQLVELVEQRMAAASERQEYEAAARYRDMLVSLRKLAEKQRMTSVGLEAMDFWAEHREGAQAALELFRMREGRVIGRREFTFDDAIDPDTFYDDVLPQFYAAEEPPPTVVLPRRPQQTRLIEEFLTQRRGARVKLRAPSKGNLRQFLDLVARNAKLAFDARFRSAHVHGVQMLEELRDMLGLDEAPYRIEGFDVSHLRGDQPRASLVVFEGGKPKKSDYRSYKVKTAGPGDDYAAMQEVVRRRYARLQREEKRMPDLILIDGGKGQLGAARAALKELGLESLSVMALAKREEEIFMEGRGEPILLSRHSPSLRLVQQIRDEAHRFALRQHRRSRSKTRIRSALLDIPGIGEKTAQRLLQQFGSVDGVKRASDEALAGAIGPAKAAVVRGALDSTDEASRAKSETAN